MEGCCKVEHKQKKINERLCIAIKNGVDIFRMCNINGGESGKIYRLQKFLISIIFLYEVSNYLNNCFFLVFCLRKKAFR